MAKNKKETGIGISRREFLAWAMAFIAEISTPSLARAVINFFTGGEEKRRADILGELETEHKITKVNEALANYLMEYPEYLEPIRETMEHRRKIGFVGLPKELREYNPTLATIGWGTSIAIEFENKLSGEMRRCGEVLQRICKEVLGDDYLKLVRKIESEGILRGTGFLNGWNQRAVTWTPLGDYTTTDTFNIGLHEGPGHGSDPLGCKFLPPKIFFDVVAGKWQMLSASREVPKQFLNSSYDEVIPIVKTDLAESVGRHWLIERDIVDLEGGNLLLNELSKLSLGSQNIMFTKEFCARLGERLFEMARGGSKTYLDKLYENKLGEMMGEIYAEMVKWRLLTEDYFDKRDTANREGVRVVASNAAITWGLQRVLSAINGREVALDVIRVNLDNYRRSLPAKLVELKPIGGKVNSGIMRAPVYSDGSEEISEVQKLLKEFLNTGKLPVFSGGENDEYLRTLRTYFDHHWRITRKYPRACEIHGNPMVSIEAFDPPYLHIWESRAISEAMSKGVVAEMIGEIAKKGDLGKFKEHIVKALPVMESLIVRVEFIKMPDVL